MVPLQQFPDELLLTTYQHAQPLRYLPIPSSDFYYSFGDVAASQRQFQPWNTCFLHLLLHLRHHQYRRTRQQR